MDITKKNYNKPTIWKTVVIAILILCALLGATWGVFAVFFPKNLADITYDMGMDSYSAKLYERHYKKTNNLDSLYLALNLSIKTENDEKVVKLFEEFYNNENYTAYIYFVNSQNNNVKASSIVKSTLLNEDNYLKNKYIQSLLAENHYVKAFDFAIADRMVESPTYTNMGNYLFTHFLIRSNIDYFCNKFYTTDIAYEETLLCKLENYVLALNTEFSDKFEKGVGEEYIIAMANRILQVANNVLNLKYKFELEDDTNLDQIISTTNQKMQLLMMG